MSMKLVLQGFTLSIAFNNEVKAVRYFDKIITVVPSVNGLVLNGALIYNDLLWLRYIQYTLRGVKTCVAIDFKKAGWRCHTRHVPVFWFNDNVIRDWNFTRMCPETLVHGEQEVSTFTITP